MLVNLFCIILTENRTVQKTWPKPIINIYRYIALNAYSGLIKTLIVTLLLVVTDYLLYSVGLWAIHETM